MSDDDEAPKPQPHEGPCVICVCNRCRLCYPHPFHSSSGPY